MEYLFNETVNVKAGPYTQTASVAKYYPERKAKFDSYSFSSDGKI